MTIKFDADEFIPTQREELKIRINKILDDFMIPLMNATIVNEIKALSSAANIPQSFINGVKFRRTAPNQGEIINTWGTEDTPLAKFFNYGTTMHWIEPTKSEGFLAWPATGGGGTHASAIFFQSGKGDKDTLFSTGHYVSGVPRTEVMEMGFNIGKKRLVVEAQKIVESELNE